MTKLSWVSCTSDCSLMFDVVPQLFLTMSNLMVKFVDCSVVALYVFFDD